MLPYLLDFLHLIFGHSLDYLLLLSGFMSQNMLILLVTCFEKNKLSRLPVKHVLIQKITIFIMISLAHGLDYLLETNDLIRNATICFYIAHEAIQTLEHATQINVLIPQKLKNAIQQLLNQQEEPHDD